MNWVDDIRRYVGDSTYSRLIKQAERIDVFSKGESFGLSEEESIALFLYTCGEGRRVQFFQMVNSSLRGLRQFQMPFENKLIDNIKSGLIKLPLYSGVAFRRSNLELADIDNIIYNKEFIDKGFLSASTESRNDFEGRIVFVIESISARDISMFSAFPTEKEVVFLPETRFNLASQSRISRALLMHLKEHAK